MSRYISIAAALLSIHLTADAQVKKFPYQARVVSDEAYIRSGGGENFYPTMALKRDAVVTVKRHDPGGWYMIEPPEGSFSWIPEKHVRQTSADTGEVLENNVVVFVGSAFGDETHVWQRRLMAGETVKILGQRQVDSLSGPKPMLKIAPPAREYRWLPGSAVIPIDAAQRKIHDQNPYAVPSHLAERQQQTQTTGPADTPTPPSRFSPSNRLALLTQIRDEQRQLRAIDQRFRSMILSAPSEWDLDRIESDYRQLQDTATHKPVAGQIDLRYPAIKRYRQRKAEFDDLKRLTSQTEQRDAELLAAQYGISTNSVGQTLPVTVQEGGMFATMDSATFSPQGGMAMNEGLLIPQPDPAFSEGEVQTISSTVGSSTGASMHTPNIPSQSRYIGAGFVQKNADGDGNGYLLTTPSGKVLAHLVPDNDVDLGAFVGKSVGLHGARYFDDKLKTDRIEVSGLESVRLR